MTYRKLVNKIFLIFKKYFCTKVINILYNCCRIQVHSPLYFFRKTYLLPNGSNKALVLRPLQHIHSLYTFSRNLQHTHTASIGTLTASTHSHSLSWVFHGLTGQFHCFFNTLLSRVDIVRVLTSALFPLQQSQRLYWHSHGL